MCVEEEEEDEMAVAEIDSVEALRLTGSTGIGNGRICSSRGAWALALLLLLLLLLPSSMARSSSTIIGAPMLALLLLLWSLWILSMSSSRAAGVNQKGVVALELLLVDEKPWNGASKSNSSSFSCMLSPKNPCMEEPQKLPGALGTTTSDAMRTNSSSGSVLAFFAGLGSYRSAAGAAAALKRWLLSALMLLRAVVLPNLFHPLAWAVFRSLVLFRETFLLIAKHEQPSSLRCTRMSSSPLSSELLACLPACLPACLLSCCCFLIYPELSGTLRPEFQICCLLASLVPVGALFGSS
mmetsp:Transcript_9219/g.16118  ORF Transcript_9219/g.16118 Transcript_9219/m.16118 type:complete len:296 (+) Transcript_9219:911-1798(+)